MKFDMHCHTKEGSSDGHVSIEEYVKSLKRQGFDGMLVTDHDSYDGYRYYIADLKDKIDFIVLRGIEYDTFDAGHMIVIMPSGVNLKLLEVRGLPVRFLIHIVHEYGGIIGPAHPCGEPFLSIFSTGRFKKRELSIASRFDFIEGYNCGEDLEANRSAQEIARRFDKPVIAGSDSHKIDNVGLAYTRFEEDIYTEDDLIAYIKAGKPTKIDGLKYYGTIKEHLGKWNKLLVYGFYPYNKFCSFINAKKRFNELKAVRRDLREKRLKEMHGLEYLRDKHEDIRIHLEDILSEDCIDQMKEYIQHGKVTTYEHCKSVAMASDALAKKLGLSGLDRHAMLRGAMLHDFYLYDWHIDKDKEHRMHGYHHAGKATDNAADLLNAELKEQEIIASHMWPLNITKIPKSREAWIVCMADKYVSLKETLFLRK